jgi:hypothetical protein
MQASRKGWKNMCLPESQKLISILDKLTKPKLNYQQATLLGFLFLIEFMTNEIKLYGKLVPC